MNLRIDSNVSEERLKKGEGIRRALSNFSNDERNAIIGYKWFTGETPENIRDSLKDLDKITSLEALTHHGICFLDEDSYLEALSQFEEKLDFEYDDHQAWSIFTALEVSRNRDFDKTNLEVFIYKEGESEPLNDINVDLSNSNSPLEIFTCKFAVEKQKEEADKKINQLKGWLSDIDDIEQIALGTFTLQPKSRIKTYFDSEPTLLVTGFDLIDVDE